MKTGKFYKTLLATAVGVALSLPAQAIMYEYDDLNRLISAQYSSGKTLNYSYDAAGNLLSVQVGNTVTDEGQIQLEIFDADGNPLANTAVVINGVTYTTDANGYVWLSEGGELTVSAEGYAPKTVNCDTNATTTKKAQKLTICHKDKETISISVNAWSAHKAHGDTQGACPVDDDDDGAVDDNADTGDDVTDDTGVTCVAVLEESIIQDGPDEEEPDTEENLDREESDPEEDSGQDAEEDQETEGTNDEVVDETPPPPPQAVPCTKMTPKPWQKCATDGEEVTKAFGFVPPGNGLDKPFTVPDLNDELSANTTTLLQDLQALFQEALDNSGFTLEQDPDSGNLLLTQGDIALTLVPKQIFQAKAGEESGVHVGTDGKMEIVTADKLKLVALPALYSAPALLKGLGKINVTAVSEMNDEGHIAIHPGLHKHFAPNYYLGKPDAVSLPALDGLPEDTLLHQDSPLLPPGNGMLIKLSFDNKHGEPYVQMIYPAAADVDALLAASNAEFEPDGPGTISFIAGGEWHTALLGYEVVTGGPKPWSNQVEFAPIGDANGDGLEDYEVTYPDGDKQKLFSVDGE